MQVGEDLLEAVAVLRVADGVHVRADDLHSERVELVCKVDRRLAAERHHHSVRLLQLDDVHDVLDGERLEVELVRRRVVGGHRFGIVVDDDGLIPRFAYGPDRVHGGVVKLDALPYPDRSGTQHDDLLAVADHALLLLLVGGIEVRHIALELARACVDHLVYGHDAELSALEEYLFLRGFPHFCEIFVRKSAAFGFLEHGDVEGIRLDHRFELNDLAYLLQEEHVDLGAGRDEPYIAAALEQLRDGEQSVVRAVLDVIVKLLPGPGVELGDPDVYGAYLKRTERLEQTLLESPAYAHHLAGRFHLRAQLVGRGVEFVEWEARDFGDDIVQRGLERRRCVGKRYLVQPHAESDLRRHTRDGIAACLGRERGRTRHAGVDLDEIVFERVGIERELHVAAALYLELADDLERAVAQHLHLFVGERLRGRHDDAVAGVHADGVEVLHAADRDRRVVCVAHDLELYLLEAFHALFHQHLPHGRELERVLHDLAKFLFVLRESAARSSQRERRTEHDGIADVVRRLLGFLDAVCDLRGNDRLADAHAHLLEFLAVFRHFDAFKRRSEQFNVAFVQNAAVREFHREVESRLSAERGDYGVGTLVAYDARDVFERQRLHVYLVRHHLVSHNGCGVGVGEHDFVPLLLQGYARLCTGVIELRRLSYDDGTGAYDKHFLYIRSLRHFSSTPRC